MQDEPLADDALTAAAASANTDDDPPVDVHDVRSIPKPHARYLSITPTPTDIHTTTPSRAAPRFDCAGLAAHLQCAVPP